MFVKKSRDVRMDDKQTFISMLEEHEKLFGEKQLQSVATDKGYYSKRNVKFLAKRDGVQIGIQVSCNTANEKIKLFILTSPASSWER